MEIQKKDSNSTDSLICKIDKELKKEFMIYCIKNDITASVLIRDYVRSILEKQQKD